MSETLPRLSIVVISFNAPDILRQCLRAATREAGADGEVIVVRRGGAPSSGGGEPHIGVRWIPAPEDAAVPHMRSLGIAASRGEIVALLEDDCVAGAGWAAAILEAHAAPCAAAGGPVEPGPYRRTRDWAVYFCEYARFMAPFSGEVDVLPGNNIAYKRSALARLGAFVESAHGFHEVFANDQLRASGDRLMASPDAVVFQINAWPRSRLTSVPYHHGRGYGGIRASGRPGVVRVTRGAATLVLPALQLARLGREVAARRRLRLRFVRSIPAIAVFLASWAAGEAVGWLLGPGDSVERWR